MGFNKVYRSLQEVFPQIDARLLKAVAIEHSKDADAAVESVLLEIIPFLGERSTTPSTGGTSSPQNAVSPSASAGGFAEVGDGYTVNGGVQPSEFDDEGRSTPNTTLLDCESLKESSEVPTDDQNVVSASVNSEVSTKVRNGYAANDGGQLSVLDAADDGHSDPISDTYVDGREGVCNGAELTFSKKTHETTSIEKNAGIDSHGVATKTLSDKDDGNILQIDGTSDLNTGTVSLGKCPESNIKASSSNISTQTLGDLQDVHDGDDQTENPFRGMVEYDNVETHGTTANQVNGHGKYWADGNSSVVSSQTLHVESGLQLLVLPDAHEVNMGELDSSLSNGTDSLMETSSNHIGTEDATLNTSMSNSNQIYMLEVLEEVTADARNNKKTMFSTMQSVISLMKEVELKEQSAEQAKVEADMGGTDILVKVEELKEIIHHAKEANSMHAGEVYGEKSILTSELRELQSRVLTLSDERDISLAVLDEMRNALEVRLAEAENKIKSAEQRKLEKETVAKAALAEQEMIMEEVVQESKILKQQAEYNAKLQEFLMDRGRVVDKLQGEIAVICQDVRLLKEKFDERVPFSKSLSSNHTSFILASSSNSSLNSLGPKQVEPAFDWTRDSLEDQNKDDPVTCFDKQSPEEKATKDDRDMLMEDGWELCDDQ